MTSAAKTDAIFLITTRDTNTADRFSVRPRTVREWRAHCYEQNRRGHARADRLARLEATRRLPEQLWNWLRGRTGFLEPGPIGRVLRLAVPRFALETRSDTNLARLKPRATTRSPNPRTPKP